MPRLVNKNPPLMEPVFDFLGKEIKVGSKIVYASLMGRSAKLTLGVVLELNKPKDPSSYYKVSIKVQPLKDSTGGNYRFKEWKWDPVTQKGEDVEIEARPVYLKFTDRLMVLE